MNQVKLKGNAVHLAGKFPELDKPVPDFKLVTEDLSEISLSNFENKIKVILSVPSLDTPVCAKQTREFNTKLGGEKDVVTIVVSGDLPFAMKRFCTSEGLEHVRVGSQFRDMNFSKNFGVHIQDGVLQGLSTRAVFVVDKNNILKYSELVPDISNEPNYGKAFEAVKKLV